MKPNTVIHYHAVIHRALKYAVKTDLIDVNPADKVDRPKKNRFTGNFYSKDEMNALFDAVRGSKIEVAVMLTAFYGLRRSEVVGLKWAAVDFEQNTIEICHTVTTVRLDGKEVLVESMAQNQIQQAHLAACTGFPGTAAGLAGGTERKPQAVR